jgi:hypothetical protein
VGGIWHIRSLLGASTGRGGRAWDRLGRRERLFGTGEGLFEGGDWAARTNEASARLRARMNEPNDGFRGDGFWFGFSGLGGARRRFRRLARHSRKRADREACATGLAAAGKLCRPAGAAPAGTNASGSTNYSSRATPVVRRCRHVAPG